MPKATFFRLPEAKKQRLMDAAYQEFARAPFNETSISNIIKHAGIPRGSYYQYFDDKADLYFYLLETVRQRTVLILQQVMTKHHGDLFPAMSEFFGKTITALAHGPHAALYRNVFLHMDFHSAAKMAGSKAPFLKPPHGHQEIHDFLLTSIDRSRLRIQTDDEVSLLIRQIVGMFMQTIAYYYSNQAEGKPITVAELKRRSDQLLDWLQFGVASDDHNHH
ncbi:TetR/AcrR family transcriptional regulator [Lacticaseibacillus zeae]|uniref:TetR/AcrR family transcriptional regulator n=1 Tax=Lacticaseibacillus zeae subsp. silagei TaxID=3068307 RepID=A0ABD7ZCQ7_LACZE|nr:MULTISPECIES: TetR/AcrR family transcriptional regulator [Lacticaseibacillus]MDE3314905.1 TetR family transcriptional regulator [Lacticaseibacillus zeae]OFR94980.1 TetR family transcriptional regulator [Lactobacillus sp. HMSC068F07]WLV84688.1 TetR/AcrR family transcriptional regulator [Lacticaseibacillus sp. NCIMB 15475]WLV87390.1 TetR/AcrR family transcriptional regulator [Lacticaseibacillus sp. NCIMB 15474]